MGNGITSWCLDEVDKPISITVLNDYNSFAEKRGAKAQYRGTVVTVHGMKTRGVWQKDISPVLQDAALRHHPVDYGYLLFGVLLPRIQDAVANKIVRAIDEQQHAVPSGPHGVIAHSFGTLCLGRALQRNPSLRLGRICLFGAIMPRDFPWQVIKKHAQYESVLNETCGRDPWPRTAAKYLSWAGAGASGCDGFLEEGASVYECPYTWTGHSRLGTKLHCENTWLPFLLDGSRPQAYAR